MGALAPIGKEQLALGDDSDARPVKAGDYGTSAWTKALGRSVAAPVRNAARPQKPGAGVPGGAETPVLGLGLCKNSKLPTA